MKTRFIRFLSASAIPAVVLGLVDCPNWRSNNNLGELGSNGGVPTIGKMTFSVGSCQLSNNNWDAEVSSFVYLRESSRTNEEFLWFDYYYNEDNACDEDNKFCYMHYTIDDNLHGELNRIRVTSIDDHCMCAGSFSGQFGQDTSFNDENCFSKAHVLCNDGDVVSIVAQSTNYPDKYFLFYSTNTVDTDLNMRSGFNQMSQDFAEVSSGKYCGTDMLKTVTYLQSDLKKEDSFGWKCKDGQDETCAENYDYGTCPDPTAVPPPPAGCSGTPSESCTLSNCFDVSGCSFTAGDSYIGPRCTGSPTPCSYFDSAEACERQAGCSYYVPPGAAACSHSGFDPLLLLISLLLSWAFGWL